MECQFAQDSEEHKLNHGTGGGQVFYARIGTAADSNAEYKQVSLQQSLTRAQYQEAFRFPADMMDAHTSMVVILFRVSDRRVEGSFVNTRDTLVNRGRILIPRVDPLYCCSVPSLPMPDQLSLIGYVVPFQGFFRRDERGVRIAFTESQLSIGKN